MMRFFKIIYSYAKFLKGSYIKHLRKIMFYLHLNCFSLVKTLYILTKVIQGCIILNTELLESQKNSFLLLVSLQVLSLSEFLNVKQLRILEFL